MLCPETTINAPILRAVKALKASTKRRSWAVDCGESGQGALNRQEKISLATGWRRQDTWPR